MGGQHGTVDGRYAVHTTLNMMPFQVLHGRPYAGRTLPWISADPSTRLKGICINPEDVNQKLLETIQPCKKEEAGAKEAKSSKVSITSNSVPRLPATFGRLPWQSWGRC